jgi:hypothetical protein
VIDTLVGISLNTTSITISLVLLIGIELSLMPYIPGSEKILFEKYTQLVAALYEATSEPGTIIEPVVEVMPVF